MDSANHPFALPAFGILHDEAANATAPSTITDLPDGGLEEDAPLPQDEPMFDHSEDDNCLSDSTDENEVPMGMVAYALCAYGDGPRRPTNLQAGVQQHRIPFGRRSCSAGRRTGPELVTWLAEY